ncbi:MAG: peptidylprolyl isomerase [Acidobacteriota bacterium]
MRLPLGAVACLTVMILAAMTLAGCSSPAERDPSIDGVESIADIVRLEDQRVKDSDPLKEVLASGELGLRVRAAQAMGRIQDPAYAEALIAAAEPELPTELRRVALFAFGQLGLESGNRVPVEPRRRLAEILQQEQEPALQALALEALGKVTPAAEASSRAQDIASYLREAEDSAVRAAAAHALFRLRFAPVWRREVEAPAVLPGVALDALEAGLADSSTTVREMSAHYFSRYAQPEAWDGLLAATSATDEWTRLWSLRGLGRVATPPTTVGEENLASARGTLAALVLGDESARVRTAAVEALTALGWTEALPAAAASDASLHVRTAVAGAWSLRGDASSQATLETFLEEDPSPTVRAAALRALARRLGGSSRDLIFSALEEGPWTLQVAAATAAPRLGSAADALDVLVRAWEEEDRRVRAAVVAALGQLDEESLVAAPASTREIAGTLLTDALNEGDLAVRGTAVDVLGRRLEAGPSLGSSGYWVDPLRSAYAQSPGVEWIEVREQIADTLASGPEAKVVPELRAIAAEDPAPSVRSRARAALAELGESAPEVAAAGSPELSPWLGEAVSGQSRVVLETEKGSLVVETFPQEAPIHVASFLQRVDEGFYDGLIWHRVVPNFVVQGGDPRGDGWGGPGYVVRDEISQRPYRRGGVGMPKAGKDTGGCQIFITHIPTPHLDGNYTLFGQVVEGDEFLDQLEVGDRIVRAFRQ